MAKILYKKRTDEPVAPTAQLPTAFKVLNKAAVRKDEPVAFEDTQDYQKVTNLLRSLSITDADVEFRTSPSSKLFVSGLLEKLRLAAGEKDAHAREGALLSYAQLADREGAECEAYLIPMLPVFLDLMADKKAQVAAAAVQAGTSLVRVTRPTSTPVVLPMVLEGLERSRKWQTKEGALKLLKALTEHAPAYATTALPDTVPLVSECLVDARAQVKEAAWTAASVCFGLACNRDIEPLTGAMLSCVARPEEVPETISALSATTFVQAVEAPALAIMVPLLVRGLQPGSPTPIKRKTAVIISNMAKLVNNAVDAASFMPRLLPGLERVAEDVPDPECRSVAAAAHATLSRIAAEGAAELAASNANKAADNTWCLDLLKEVVAVSPKQEEVDAPTLWLVSSLCSKLISRSCFDYDEWSKVVVGSIAPSFMSESQAADTCRAFMARCAERTSVCKSDSDNGWDDDDEGEELCNCQFSLAYGGKILLNNAVLRLKRGHRYGLCGQNGVGKSTLLKAIAGGKVDGFPPMEQLKTVYVEHDIQAALADFPVVDFVTEVLASVTRDEVTRVLSGMGFSQDNLALPVSKLSGGWKMKLALARASLMGADIFLLDEPTNHLDVVNVAWLEDYLVKQTHITVITVSHDSGFLDAVCTDIIHYHERKLKKHRGNLSEFVKAVPAAQTYYQLEAATLKFRFPIPGLLDGINSKEKPIVKMAKITFTYPGAAKPQLVNVSVACRLSSRIAVLGANGAGKSTLIKILTGELKPQSGSVTKHPNLRVAYVAQHAFHHIEHHLDKSPNQYIMHRYSQGEDREEQQKVTRVISEEEERKMREQVWMIDGYPRVLDKLVGRRKKRRSFEYEVKWRGLDSIKFNRWITREELEERGFVKLLNEYDGKKASEVGDTRPLTKAVVEQYLTDFGLEPEFGTHSAIRGLSGGQKVKLVLAAAMWHNPHLLVMDEPTNYLDRESLGALAAAIKEFHGGVVLISHHGEFTSAICSEEWHVAGGAVTIKKADVVAEGQEEGEGK